MQRDSSKPPDWSLCFYKMGQEKALPPREYNDITRLLEMHTKSNNCTRSDSILAALHLLCDDSRTLGIKKPGRIPFLYDTFYGGHGFDLLYAKKSDVIFYPLRWLCRAWHEETNCPLPDCMCEKICKATGGLLFSKQLDANIRRDYETIFEWCKQPRHDRYGEVEPLPDNWIDDDDHWDLEYVTM